MPRIPIAMLALCLLGGGCMSVPPDPGFSGARLDGGWLVCERLTVGTGGRCEDVHARREKDFEVEIFHKDGVMTCLRESLPERVLKMLDSVKSPPEGEPPGFAFPAGGLSLYSKVKFGWSYAELVAALGKPFSGRPAFDIHSGRHISEYYWKCPEGEGILAVRSNGDYVIEKRLFKSLGRACSAGDGV